jgi:hypothetical protein
MNRREIFCSGLVVMPTQPGQHERRDHSPQHQPHPEPFRERSVLSELGLGGVQVLQDGGNDVEERTALRERRTWFETEEDQLAGRDERGRNERKKVRVRRK